MKLEIHLPPEQIATVLAKAKADVPHLFEIETKCRLGKQGDSMSKYIFWDAEGRVRPVFGILGDAELPIDSKYAESAVAKALILRDQIPVVAFISEAWMADQCAECGAKLKEGGCGHEPDPAVSKNPYRKEVTIIQLSAYPGDKMWHWAYEIERNEFDVTVGYKPHIEGVEVEAHGALAHYWDLQPMEAPLFTMACRDFGGEYPPWVNRLWEVMIEPAVALGYPRLRFGVTDDVDGLAVALADPGDN